jgi:protein-tyrosine-phosphatase/DNA-binding transcriptional ArsR family regulator
MKMKSIVAALSALAQESRLAIFKLLVQAGPTGLAAGHLSEMTGVAPSSLSFHLKEMTHANMVSSRQEGRYVIYSANFDTMNTLLSYLTENCCNGVPCTPLECSPRQDLMPKETIMSEHLAVDRHYNVLILCTGNSARSIMAEAIFNTLHDKKFTAYSAGSDPTGMVNPFAIEVVKSIGYHTENLRSKSWDEFSGPDAPHMDFVFTVCDKAAGQSCPIWPGHPVSAHWGFEDPAAFEGTDQEKHKQFLKIFHQIRSRIQIFAALPFNTLDRSALQHEASKIGQAPVSE